MDWFDLWQNKGKSSDFLIQTGRGNSFNLDRFILFMQDVNHALDLQKTDVLLDAGGASGWISLWLLPFVKSVTMFDYSKEMIIKAQRQTAGFDNITVFQDDILNMTKVSGKYSKVLVGSVLQYLDSMEQVKTAMKNIYNVMDDGGIALLTHNPDITKQGRHFNTYKDEIPDWEHKRLWLDIQEIYYAAMKIGFKGCKKTPINPLIWQSSHMFDFVVIK